LSAHSKSGRCPRGQPLEIPGRFEKLRVLRAGTARTTFLCALQLCFEEIFDPSPRPYPLGGEMEMSPLR